MMARSITADPELTTAAQRPAVRPKRRRNNTWVGILGWLLGILFFGILAFVLGISSRMQIKRAEGKLWGAALAGWGMGISVVGLGLGFLLLPAT